MRSFRELINRVANRVRTATAWMLAGALLPAAMASAQASVLPARLDLYGGQVAVYQLDRPIDRVAVGNGELLQVTTIQKRQLVVIASPGNQGFTALHIWFEDGSQRTLDVNVNPANTSGLSGAIRQMLGPDSRVEVTDVGGYTVLSGELSVADAARVQALKGAYPDLIDLTAADPVGMKPMVLMDVRIMEFRRDALRDLGIRWDSTIDGPTGGTIGDFRNSFYRVLPENSPFWDIDLPSRISPMQTYFGLATTIGSRINLLTTSGQAWELANPQLSARSGGAAEFLVGGRLPIPMVNSLGQTYIQFEDYGIKLEISPVVNSDREISAEVYTEISNIDPSIQVMGVPGFTTREARTEINVLDGETIVISGLVDIQGAKAMEGIPGLSRIPVLGRLFRSDNFRSGRTDLVVFVTPRIVTPGSRENLELIDRSDRMLQGFKENFAPDIFD